MSRVSLVKRRTLTDIPTEEPSGSLSPRPSPGSGARRGRREEGFQAPGRSGSRSWKSEERRSPRPFGTAAGVALFMRRGDEEPSSPMAPRRHSQSAAAAAPAARSPRTAWKSAVATFGERRVHVAQEERRQAGVGPGWPSASEILREVGVQETRRERTSEELDEEFSRLLQELHASEATGLDGELWQDAASPAMEAGARRRSTAASPTTFAAQVEAVERRLGAKVGDDWAADGDDDGAGPEKGDGGASVADSDDARRADAEGGGKTLAGDGGAIGQPVAELGGKASDDAGRTGAKAPVPQTSSAGTTVPPSPMESESSCSAGPVSRRVSEMADTVRRVRVQLQVVAGLSAQIECMPGTRDQRIDACGEVV